MLTMRFVILAAFDEMFSFRSAPVLVVHCLIYTHLIYSCTALIIAGVSFIPSGRNDFATLGAMLLLG